MPDLIRYTPWSCGLPCAPMLVRAHRGRLLVREGGCPDCRESLALPLDGTAAPRVAGKKVGLARAIEAAVGLLREARRPFVYGLSRSCSGTAGRAAALAAAAGGAIDIEGADAVQADLVALQTYGLPSATFGEIRARADLLLMWRCDPRPTHPLLLSRSSGQAGAAPSPAAVLLVPAAGSAPAAGDILLPLDEGRDLAAALALRALVNGVPFDDLSAGDLPAAPLRMAAERLLAARYSAILWGPRTGHGERDFDAADGVATRVPLIATLTLLARDLNRRGRGVARPLGGGGNVAGGMAALAAVTGYPRTVGFAGGAWRYAPGEFCVERLLRRGGADLLLLVGGRCDTNIDDTTREDPTRRRTIVIGPRPPDGALGADVFIPTATPGVSAAGTATRADGVTVLLKAHLPSRLPTEDAVLDRLLQGLGTAPPAASRQAAPHPRSPSRRG